VKASVASTALFLFLVLPPAQAFAFHSDDSLDAASLAQLEDRAEHAGPREQCFLFTELVQHYTDVAGKQMAAGEMDQASASLKRIRTFADRIHLGLARDTKRLKNAEMLMHAATFHLNQFMRMVSTEDKAIVEMTLKQLNKVHDELLAQVFAH
jgi:hypothetical protein